MIQPNQPGGSKYVVRGGSKIVVIDTLPDEITTMADALGGQFGLKDNLKGLKDGTSNPTSQLIDALRNKSMVGKLIPETEIEAKLITPFESGC